MTLFDLAAKLTLDSSGFEKGVSDASEKGQSLGSKLASALGTGAKVAGAAIAAVGTAAVAAGTAMVKAAGETAAYGDNIDKMSQKMGLSAEAYQEWDFIMQHSGTTIEGMTRGMTTLNKAAENGSDAFDKLGISQEEVASLNQEQLFARTIEALQGMEAGSERAVLAQELLGGAAKELGPLLNTTAEDTEAMRQQVHELGGVMSNEAVKAAAAYQDSLQNMQTAFTGLQRGLTSEFMPGITSVMDGLTAIFSGDSDSGLAQIQQGISGLVSTISSQIPRIVQIGSGIVTSLLTAITQNLPTLLTAGANMVIQIGQGLLGNLPQIVQAALQVVVTLAQSISSNIKELVPVAIDVVMQIADTLTDPSTLVMLLEAGLTMIISLAESLIDNMPRLLEKMPIIIENVTNALIEAVPMLLEAAIQLIIMLGTYIIQELPRLIARIPEIVTGLVSKLISEAPRMFSPATELIKQMIEGIKSMISSVVDKAREIVDNFRQKILDKAGELVNAGYNLVVGIWNGISDAAGWLWDQIAGFASNIVSKFKAFLGIRSPSKVMRDKVGKPITQGIAEGMKDELPTVEQAAKDLAAAMTGTMKYEAEKDYSALMLMAKDYEEFIRLAALREAKIDGERVEMKRHQYKTTIELYEQWRNAASELAYEAEKDYTALILHSKSLEEAMEYAKLRDAKIVGESIDIVANGWRTTEQILEEWRASTVATGEETETAVDDAVERATKKAKTLVDAVQEQLDKVEELLRKMESNFKAIGKNMMVMMAEGIRDGMPRMLEAVRSAIRQAMQTATSEAGIVYDTGPMAVASPVSVAATPAALVQRSTEAVSNHINIRFDGDLAQLGRILQPVIETEERRVGGKLVMA